ncbi:protein artichoke, partial [Vespula maculifrons]
AQTVLIKDSRVSRNKFSDRSLINNYRELESVHHRRGSQPTSMSTYLIFNQLQIIHPQFRPKSRSSVLEPSQNFLNIVVRARSKEEAICRRGPHKLWLKRATFKLLSYFRRFHRTFRKWLLVHILILPCCHSKCSYVVVM